MLTEYIDEALKRTRYELIQDEEPYYGEIKALPGIWASGRTLEECRRNLKEGLEGWILLSVKKGIPTPKLGRFEVAGMEQEVLEAGLSPVSHRGLVRGLRAFGFQESSPPASEQAPRLLEHGVRSSPPLASQKILDTFSQSMFND